MGTPTLKTVHDQQNGCTREHLAHWRWTLIVPLALLVLLLETVIWVCDALAAQMVRGVEWLAGARHG